MLTITHTFDASPEEVFKAWTDSKRLAEWYGPEGFENEIHEFDAREGGAYRLTMLGPKGERHTLRGKFITVQSPKRLVVSWQWEPEEKGAPIGRETVVSVDFKEVAGKTEMTMTHAGFADEKEKEMHNQGWSSSFNKLEKMFG